MRRYASQYETVYVKRNLNTLEGAKAYAKVCFENKRNRYARVGVYDDDKNANMYKVVCFKKVLVECF